MRGPGPGLCALLAAAAFAVPAAATPGLVVIYSHAPAAAAIHDGAPGLSGLRTAWRQAPIFDDRRFPVSRQLGKVSGAELAQMSPAGMARALRAGWSGGGGRVGIEEITVADWDAARAAALAQALDLLGPDAERVVAYVSPGLVGAVGLRDPRRPLPPHLAGVVDALRRAGAVFLVTYHGDGSPFSRAETATYVSRWLGRWPPAGPGRLHLMLGPDHGLGQAEVWGRARSSAAGRQILANGAGAWGLRTAAEGRDWLAAHAAFSADPLAPPPGGDHPVPTGGGLSIDGLAGWAVRVTIARPARAVVRLVPAGQGRGRVIAKLQGPVTAARVRLPLDVRPGRYRVVAVALGDGLRDVAQLRVRVTRDRISRETATRRRRSLPTNRPAAVRPASPTGSQVTP